MIYSNNKSTQLKVNSTKITFSKMENPCRVQVTSAHWYKLFKVEKVNLQYASNKGRVFEEPGFSDRIIYLPDSPKKNNHPPYIRMVIFYIVYQAKAPETLFEGKDCQMFFFFRKFWCVIFQNSLRPSNQPKPKLSGQNPLPPVPAPTCPFVSLRPKDKRSFKALRQDVTQKFFTIVTCSDLEVTESKVGDFFLCCVKVRVYHCWWCWFKKGGSGGIWWNTKHEPTKKRLFFTWNAKNKTFCFYMDLPNISHIKIWKHPLETTFYT